jgi:protein involved in polysaccharide export with SLBB domain
LLNGDKSLDVRLQSGDVLHFPPMKAQAAIAGSVKSPGIFEVLPTTSIGDLVALAGGLSTTAGGGRVIVERIEDRRARQVAEFSLDGADAQRLIRDGDVVQINPISPRFENTITIRGYVPETQRLAFKAGMRVTDVLPSQMALLANSYWLRKNEKGRGYHWLLESGPRGNGPEPGLGGTQDFRGRSSSDGSAPTRQAAARGDRSDGLQRPQLDGMSPLASLRAYRDEDESASVNAGWSRRDDPGQSELLDDLTRSSVEVNWDYALIERLDPQTLRTNLLPFHLGRAMVDRDPSENKLLEPGDIITVFSTKDIRVPVERQPQYVKLEGEVGRPGVYQITYGDTLASLIVRAGGLTTHAYLYGSEFTREDTREFQQRELDASVDRLSQSLERSAATRLRESLDGGTPGTPDSATGMLDAQRRLVRKLRQVKATGRIVMDVTPGQSNLDHLDIPLEDGDRFYVPARPSTVSVVGAVNRPNAMLYRDGRSLDDYLLQAGGSTRDAALADMFVIRPNGSVQSVKASSWLNKSRNAILLPGDTIVVPEDTDSVTWRRVLRDWTQIVYQGSLGVAGIRLLNDVLRR